MTAASLRSHHEAARRGAAPAEPSAAGDEVSQVMAEWAMAQHVAGVAARTIAERRQTVQRFARLAGQTPEALDPKTVADILSGLNARLRRDYRRRLLMWFRYLVSIGLRDDEAIPAAPRRVTQDSERPVQRHLRWLEERGMRQSSVQSRLYHLLRVVDFFRERGTPIDLDDLLTLDRRDLAAWRSHLSARLTPGAQQGYVSQVRGFYRWAVAENLIDEDPMRGLPLPKVPRRLPRPIGQTRLEEAVSTARGRVRPMLVLAGWAGLRAFEIAQLEWSDVYLDDTPPHLVVANGKGGKQRVVPLHPDVVSALREHGAHGRRGFVFPRLDGQAGHLKPWMVSRLCNLHLHSLGIEETLHQLRHRFGTEAYRACQDLRVVQELMGHAYPSTTSGYVAFSNDVAFQAVTALPASSRL